MAAGLIDAYASKPHYLHHIQQIWTSVPAEHRGSLLTAPTPGGQLTLVASYADLKAVRKVGRPTILAEHGTGQSYLGTTNGSYIGAPDRAGVAAVLVPGASQAARHLAAHPTIPAYVTGVRPAARPGPGDGTVAISFHWDCQIVPETRSALRWYRPALARLAAAVPLIGHAHPRHMGQVARLYDRLGIEPVASFDEVCERADVYAVDNSSTLYEFAALDRPVVVLNAPWYRRDVHHGMRFWEHADMGVQVDDPRDLVDGVTSSYADPCAARRSAVIDEVFTPGEIPWPDLIGEVRCSIPSRS